MVFAPRAGVIDKVPASRMTRHWTLRRQYRVGTTWSRTAVELAPAGIAAAVDPAAADRRRRGAGRGRRAPPRPRPGHRVAHPPGPGQPDPAAGTGDGGGRLGRHHHRVPAPGRADAVSRSGSSRPGAATGSLRKRAKRAWSHVWLAGLRVRNRLTLGIGAGRSARDRVADQLRSPGRDRRVRHRVDRRRADQAAAADPVAGRSRRSTSTGRPRCGGWRPGAWRSG